MHILYTMLFLKRKDERKKEKATQLQKPLMLLDNLLQYKYTLLLLEFLHRLMK